MTSSRASRRDFGSVRRLASGRWQARYPGAAGRLLAAPQTFATKAEATGYLAALRTDQGRGVWVDPAVGRVPFAEYAATWMQLREIRPRTRELYTSLLANHLRPTFGDSPLVKITPLAVRAWRAERLAAGIGGSTIAKAYRLLKAILATAVQDELIARNPCLLPGAGSERPPERVPPTIAEAEAIADAIEDRYRVLVLLGAWSGLRWGELIGLTRSSIDLLHGTVTVSQAMVELGSSAYVGPPKSDAGRRTVHIPPHLIPEVEWHLEKYVRCVPDAMVFTGPRDGTVRRNNFNGTWHRARAAAGVPALRFHDLRHLAATLAATTGATTRELMASMGHASPRAALIYQHATRDRDMAIAAALSDLRAATIVPLPTQDRHPATWP